MNKILDNYKRINEDVYFQNLIAQSYSRSILRDVNEPLENYPKYDEELDTKLIAIFQMYLNTALRVDFDETDFELINIRTDSFKLAADILKNMYHYGIEKPEKDYYILIASMAYYLSGDYSKSFAVMKNFNEKNAITNLVSHFLKKEYTILYEEVLFNFSAQIPKSESEMEMDSHIYLKILSIAMNNFLRYLTTGNDAFIYEAIENTSDLIELTELDNDVLAWYIFKLLNFLFKCFHRVSLWKIIPPLIQRKEVVDKYILNNLFNSPSIVELFPFQIEALVKSMNPSGAVLALPTSSGKTKIAEINILKTLVEDPNAIILYLAPFKSLAYEIEDTLKKNLSNLDINISNMYGDGTESLFDDFLRGQSNVLIVTPEKAKMILRNDNDIKERLKLIILDEGHLIGGDLRFTRNELFYEELKYYVMKVNGKFLVLSAILPNSSEVAEWFTRDSQNKYVLNRTKNDKRFGVLLYTKNNVSIKWKGKSNPFNHNFVDNIKLTDKVILPNSKRTSVILSALKFSNSGKVLIYLARKDMIKGYIKDYSRILDHLEDHCWEEKYWNEYLFNLKTFYGEDSIFEKVALKGIIVHHASLPNDLRIATEKILRYSNPKIIIATSTLAQGVNIGVSTVIIGHYRVTKDLISNGEFNNIIGRAGRSFVDVEGKVLFAIDANQSTKKNKWEIGIFESFINGIIERVESGIYYVLRYIYRLSIKNKVSFETLLEIISNNESLEDNSYLHLLDDTLLAILNEEDFDVNNLDEFIDNSFAILLAANKAEDFNEEKLKRMLIARANYIKTTYQDATKKEMYLQAGIALTFIKLLEENLSSIEEILQQEYYLDELISRILDIANSDLNIYRNDNYDISKEHIYEWISGEQINESTYTNFKWNKLYYELPLIVNTLSKILLFNQKEECSEKLLNFNECLKYGLPNIAAVKIYLLGLNSREVATKIAEKYYSEILQIDDRFGLKLLLMTKSKDILEEFNETEFFLIVQSWFEKEFSERSLNTPEIRLRIRNVSSEINEFRLMEIDNKYFLITLDLNTKIQLNLNTGTLEGKEYIINNIKYSFIREADDVFVLKTYND
ncbi:DEAD/DEAH box helicase [Lysinibacillus sp. F5]|uniref:DEAD/DEAH box helicase n=1 Tax=Lysinibacillus sp. F5 TaxID=1700846 RepID=UPI000738A167|nr:DEAD/DEAH box helicase [Lysinibacillus sp. F5]KUF28630.1 hypothetical protein AK833_20565 [Lysinibacillus sp. F5]